jgi:biopolymer transport protein ExbB
VFAILQAAGWPVWPLVACSVLALALIAERFWSLRTSRVAPPSLLNDLQQFDGKALPGRETADKLAAHSLLGSVLAAGLRVVQADPKTSDARLRQAFEIAGRSAVHELERYLTLLGTIATAAPLLGLLGTVVGMIEIFGSQTPGTGNPAQLAQGISIALYNTAFGLVVAIPALVCHRHFRRLVDGFELALESASERFYTQLTRHTHAAMRTPRPAAQNPAQNPSATPAPSRAPTAAQPARPRT